MPSSAAPNTFEIFTIGHSNLSLEGFFALLRRHSIQILVDVRSRPYSKYAKQFNKHQLERAVKPEGIKYLFLGKELGGQPDDKEFYDKENYVLYERLAKSTIFIEGISRIIKGLQTGYRIALLCGEENPKECHRRLLVGRVLYNKGVKVKHIRRDGRLQTEKEVRATESREMSQCSLFGDEKTVTWKSTQSVLQKKQQQISLGS